jgi:hypothetical protein
VNDAIKKATAAEAKLAQIARTRRPTKAERLEALEAYLAAAESMGHATTELRETIAEVREADCKQMIGRTKREKTSK